MEERRGGKKKKHWQLALGVKEVAFAALGVTGLMMMSFALGTLSGRGDIYRVLYNWGLLPPEAPKVAQVWQPPAPVAAAPVQPEAAAVPAPVANAAAPGNAGAAPGSAAAPVAAAPAPAAQAAAPAAPVTGNIAGLPGSTTTSAKKSKGASAHKEQQKSKDEEMRRIRQEVVSKLKFQNSFDTSPTKSARQAQKSKEKAKEKTAAKPKETQLAMFRDGKAAKAKLAELQKKGEKVTLKTGKDQKGAYYVICRQIPAAAAPEAKTPAKSAKPAETKAPAPAQH